MVQQSYSLLFKQREALLHKPTNEVLFRNIIRKWISLPLKFIVQQIDYPTIVLWSIVEIFQFGLILRLNGVRSHKISMDENKLTQIQRFNVVLKFTDVAKAFE